MTETVKTAQDETSKDSANPSTGKNVRAAKLTSDGNERSKQADKSEKPPSKIVVRRLPPTMTLETFVEQVSPLPPVDFMYFVKADSTLSPNSFCRAYLHFVHVDDMLIFTEKFDNYVFVDGKGNEFPAIVEYAPFQRIPKQRSTRKKDPRVGTIENDPYFQEFIEALKAEEAQRKSASKTNKQHFFETSASPAVQKITTTPLLEFLKNRRADKMRSREDRLAERRKREAERRKAREDVRGALKPIHSDGDASNIISSPIKIAGHGVTIEKSQKDPVDKKPFRVAVPPSRLERERERKERERESRKESRKDNTREKEAKPESESSSVKDTDNSQDKSKENPSVLSDTRQKDVRKAGKSYQEERQRLNERRQVSKGSNSKASSTDDGSHSNDRDENSLVDDRKGFSKKDGSHDKYRGSENSRNQNFRDTKKTEKFGKSLCREQEQRKNYDSRKNVEIHGEKKESKKAQDDKQSDLSQTLEPPLNKDQSIKSFPLKEEIRKKSYNQEREQRRAADKKIPNKKESGQSSKHDDHKGKEPKEDSCTKSLDTKNKLEEESDASERDHSKGGGDSFDKDKASRSNGQEREPSMKTKPSRIAHEDGDACRKTDTKSKAEEKDRKDPRAERRIRNKDRPSMEIYRPGMGRFSRQRLEREKGKGSSTERDSPSSSPSPIPSAAKSSTVPEK